MADLYSIILQAERQGDTYVEVPLGHQDPDERICIEGTLASKRDTLAAELAIANHVTVDDSQARAFQSSPAHRKTYSTLSDEQYEAMTQIPQIGTYIITGGPGSGKTYMVNSIAQAFRKLGKRVVLAAPTGRAAQRMGQVCNMEASTIHRLLRWTKDGFLHNEYDPVPADVFIIDEASMLDVHLGAALVKGIPRYAVLVLVGDKDQLPSVGPGRVFADLIESGPVGVSYLTRIFRQGEGSGISKLAADINQGTVSALSLPGDGSSDVVMLPAATQAEALVHVLHYASRLPAQLKVRPDSVVVIAPTNVGPLGVVKLNIALQQKLNPSTAAGVSIHDGVARKGDMVCQRVNNYMIDTKGVFNGDMGTVESVNEAVGGLVVRLWDGRIISYSPHNARQLSLAFAMSVHRAQGLEMECVILVVDDSHGPLLTRNLIYTAVTRAKRLLLIIGSTHALQIAVRNNASNLRATRLKEKMSTLNQDLPWHTTVPHKPV